MYKLESKEVNSVTSYIGGNGGYLNNFSYATHASFYPHYCGLEIDTNHYEGTTRQRFTTILIEASAMDQSKILLGVLEKLPLSCFEELLQEEIISLYEFKLKKELQEKITKWIERLREQGLVDINVLKHNSTFVRDVLDQCDTLVSAHKCSSGVDRAHTALHAYFKEVCTDTGIHINESNPNLQHFWSKIKSEHPKFVIDITEHNKPINQIVTTLAKILENMNDIRNKQSFSHPNDEIIGEEEARLVINISRVLLQYIDGKVNLKSNPKFTI